ncbi:MAG: hypothetical protein HRU03_03405 [Nanoarchaeales archaeon]|nr:hypothetical protein [Nanoarchaeales archaeon]
MIITSLKVLKDYNCLKKNKCGAIEMDELGRLIIGLVFFIVLIYIVTVIIGGDIKSQEEDIGDVFSTLG